MKKVLNDLAETGKAAEIVIEKILQSKVKNVGATVVALSGELGAGKTSFTQAVAKYLGIKHKIISPTFVIMKKYPLKVGKYKHLFHLDAYRLKNENELNILGWSDIVASAENLIFIEWPENVKKLIPKDAVRISLKHHKNNSRILEMK